jgi:aryl-alcohol dehydrogenase-like predicted oxidoreductase
MIWGMVGLSACFLDRGWVVVLLSSVAPSDARVRHREMFLGCSHAIVSRMRMRQLGSNGPEMSVIGFGAWEAGGDAWGTNESEDEVIGAMRAGLDVGMSWIDTAEVYGKGTSEGLVGRAVAGRRDQVVVASKLGPAPEGSGFRPDEVRAGCEASLGRLGIDVIDLYQLHWPDSTGVPIEDTWGAMGDLQDAGKVRHIGVSNFDQALIERCEAVRHVDSLQQEFSMLSLNDRDLIRWCGEHGTGVVTYGPLGFGLLTGKISREQAVSATDWRRSEDDGPFSDQRLDHDLPIVEGLKPIAERLGITMAQLALAWNVAQPGVTSAIAGSRDAAHTRDNAAAGDVELDDQTMPEIEGLLTG